MEIKTSRKSIAVKKFIENFYTEYDIKEVKFDINRMDIPTLIVYFNQTSEARNENTVFQYQIIEDVRKYLNIKSIPTSLLSWEYTLSKYKNPDLRIEVISLNQPT